MYVPNHHVVERDERLWYEKKANPSRSERYVLGLPEKLPDWSVDARVMDDGAAGNRFRREWCVRYGQGMYEAKFRVLQIEKIFCINLLWAVVNNNDIYYNKRDAGKIGRAKKL